MPFLLSRSRWVAVVACCLGVLLPAAAAAFCRQMTCEPVTCDGASSDECEEVDCRLGADGCIAEGVSLHYPSHCLQFGVSRGAAQQVGLSDEELESIIIEAFERWRNVDCGEGQGPGFVIQSAGIVDTQGNHFCQQLPALNLSVWTLSEDWSYQGRSLGYTTSTFGVDDGVIFDADVEFNVAHIVDNFSADLMPQVTLAIATHEAGHFLGLAHSEDRTAIMAAAYSDSDLLKRDFSQDDIDGICTIYPPDTMPDQCSAPGYTDVALTAAACEEAATESAEGCSVVTLGAGRRVVGRGQGFGMWVVLVALVSSAALTRRRTFLY
jgi:hypothetical protein